MTRRNPEKGAAMLVTMIVIMALLAGAAALTQVQLSSTRSAHLTRTSQRAMHCAEAGLATARGVVAANYNQWSSALAMYPVTAEPTWLATAIGSHDLDGDSNADFTVYIVDNEDELPANDPRTNNDMMVWVVSRCLHDVEISREVRELIEVTAGARAYESQLGGGTGANNRTQ